MPGGMPGGGLAPPIPLGGIGSRGGIGVRIPIGIGIMGRMPGGIGIPGIIPGGMGICGGIGRIISPVGGGPTGGRGTARGTARGAGSAGWYCAQYSITFIMCLRPEWCCLRPGTEECVSAMSQYSQ